jgi:D-alanyl-D-alanine carboxypeptidase
MNRRDLLTSGIVATSAALASFRVSAAQPTASSPYLPAFEPLDHFVEQFLRDMNAPGLTLALADSNGVQRVCAYGLNDLARHTPLNVDELFHIGSISKSFLAVCLLQLHDEGKLDLHRPIEQYLPWLRFDGLGRSLTAHDLLTHTAGLPDGPLFPTDPALRHRATTAPGAHFHYCNMGYAALGHLLAQLDGRPMEDCFRARILTPARHVGDRTDHHAGCLRSHGDELPSQPQ